MKRTKVLYVILIATLLVSSSALVGQTSHAQGLPQQPDLIVDKIVCASNNKLAFTIKNQGTAGLPDGWVALARVLVNQQQMGSYDLRYPTSKTNGGIEDLEGSSYYLTALDITSQISVTVNADYLNSVSESNEQNNSKAQVVAPCAATPSPTPTTTPTPKPTPSPSPTPTPTPTPTTTPTPTPTPTPTLPPNAKITVEQTPKTPKLGDRITYFVTGSDPEGVALIEIWLDGKLKKRCANSPCRYDSPPITQEPDVGVAVIDESGNIATQGNLPLEEAAMSGWAVEDADHDGIINRVDNCPYYANPEQTDSDEDGVGDACDQCDLNRFNCDEEWNYCDGSRELYEYEAEGTNYFDQYDLIARNGCGCTDTDRGLDYYEQGMVLSEEVTWRDISTYQSGYRCVTSSDCEVAGTDFCTGSSLTEFYCDSNGCGNRTVQCPYGCSNGACNCPDTDEGTNYYTQGTVGGHTDECVDATHLREWSCGGISTDGQPITRDEIVTCPYGCSNGACGCSDSDNGQNYEVKGVVGTYEDKCDCDNCVDSRWLTEYYTMGSSETYCYVNSTRHRCDGLCSNGQCLLPTCTDGIKNQGEDNIDCGGPCTPCGMVAIKGKILYEDGKSDGTSLGFRPVRFGKFKIKGEISSDTQSTRSDGSFNVVIPRTGKVGKEVYVYLGGCSLYNAGFNYAVKIAGDLDDCNRYVSWESYSLQIPESGDVDFGELKIGMSSGNFTGTNRQYAVIAGDDPCRKGVCQHRQSTFYGGSVYFNIAEVVLAAREYADGMRADSDGIGKVTVEYPDHEWSNYRPYYEVIKLSREHGFDDGVIVHEFGHHLEKKISAHDYYTGDSSHSFCSDKDDTEFAWSEGFAEYFGTIVPHHYNDPTRPNVPYLCCPDIQECTMEAPPCYDRCSCLDESGNWCQNVDGAYVCCGTNNPCPCFDSCCGHSGKDMESTVAAVLWDLVDIVRSDFPNSVIEPFDRISDREELIFAIFDTDLDNCCDAPDLCEFVREGWDCDLGGAWRDMIDALLEHYNVNCSRGCGK